MNYVEGAAIAASVLLAVVAAFQVALAAGAPLGEATMGGRAATVNGVLAPAYRAMALVSAVILLIAAWIVLARAGVVTTSLDERILVWGTWFVAGFTARNTLTNLSGRHPLERWGWSSVTLVAAPLIGFVAFAAP